MRPVSRIVVALILASQISSSCLAVALQFSGRTWAVKPSIFGGPGPNNWSDSPDSVFVDGLGRLHLKIREISPGNWVSSQVALVQSLGHGTYEFRLDSDTELFDQNAVVGLFTFANNFEEIDIELTKFGNPANTNAHFTVQPYTIPGNQANFDLNLNSNLSTHKFTWSPTGIDFLSLQGHQSTPSQPSDIISQFNFTGPSNPPANGFERAFINFWLNQGNAPTNGLEHELIISNFAFTPLGATSNADFDSSTVVDGADFLNWQRNFLATGQIDNSNGDADLNGVIESADLTVWESQFGTSPAIAAGGAVPEPASCWLALCCGSLLAWNARRKR